MTEDVTKRFKLLQGRENYDTWRIAAKSYLVIKGLWSWALKLPDPQKQNEVDIDLKAWSELNLLIDESLYSYIADTTSTKAAWEALESLYEDSGLCRRVELLKQLVKLSLDDCSSVEEYVKTMISTSLKVKRAGLKIDDETVASVMLAGLPDDFQPVVMALENSPAKLTTDSVKTLLLQDSRFQELKVKDSVFSARSKMKQRSKENTTFRCHNCGQDGHFAKHCPAQKESLRSMYAVGIPNSEGGSKTVF